MDPELQYQWFIAGLAPGERQSVTAWAADRELKGEVVGLDTMVQFLRKKESRNTTATDLADKGELLGGRKPDLEPIYVEAFAARAAFSCSTNVVPRPASATTFGAGALGK